MSGWMLVAGILPVFIFVIVEQYSGLKAALVVAVLLSLGEIGLSLYATGGIDTLTVISVGAIVLMALISYKTQSGIWFKMQPVILSLLCFIVFVGTYMMGEPIVPAFMLKYKKLFPDSYAPLIEHEVFVKYLSLGTLYLGIALFFHALITAYAALKLSSWWWLMIRVVGFYAFAFFAIILAGQSVDLNQISGLIFEALNS